MIWLVAGAIAAPFEVKGLTLGAPVPKDVFATAGTGVTVWGFGVYERTTTVGGASGTMRYALDTTTGEVVWIGFEFKSADWESVRDAVRTKYPTVTCASSTIQNRMGATFPQEVCATKEADGSTLTASRCSSTVTEGSLAVTSARWRTAADAATKANSTDM